MGKAWKEWIFLTKMHQTVFREAASFRSLVGMGPWTLTYSICVSRIMIKNKARSPHWGKKCKEMELPPTLKASVGWVQKFMTRNGLCIVNTRQMNPSRILKNLLKVDSISQTKKRLKVFLAFYFLFIYKLR